MRSILFLLLMGLTFTSTSFAETGEEVCASISFSSDREECTAFIRGRYFDIDAGYVCIRARFNSGKLECVKNSADKEYTLTEANTCDDETFDDDRVECMKNSGRPVDDDGGSYSQRLRSVNRLSVQAMNHLNNGNVRKAYQALGKIQTLSDISK